MATRKHRIPQKDLEHQCQVEALQQILDDTTAQLKRLKDERLRLITGSNSELDYKNGIIRELREKLNDIKAVVVEYRKARDYWFEKYVKLEHKTKERKITSSGLMTGVVDFMKDKGFKVSGCQTGRVPCSESNITEKEKA